MTRTAVADGMRLRVRQHVFCATHYGQPLQLLMHVMLVPKVGHFQPAGQSEAAQSQLTRREPSAAISSTIPCDVCQINLAK